MTVVCAAKMKLNAIWLHGRGGHVLQSVTLQLTKCSPSILINPTVKSVDRRLQS